ncbi:MAG: hypothetical protein ISR91_01820 [Candidatus Delongbacteria bacterium]|nr:hypothetical protein [Candidatus Delongbacteria bacterium]
MRILKALLVIPLTIITLLLLLIIIWAGWERTRDPLAALDRDAGLVSVLQDSAFQLDVTTAPRSYRQVVLTTERLGEITVSFSLPLEIPTGGLPLIVVLGGLEIGEANFEMIDDPGANIIAIYHYPYSPEYWYAATTISDIPLIRRAVLQVPAQVATLIEWAGTADWIDAERISVTGYSFGAMFLPALYHLAEGNNLRLGPGVIAYAGTDIGSLLHANLVDIQEPERTLLAWLAATAIFPLEPAAHLPHLSNEFLLINGTSDHQIPEESWRRLHQLTPEPRRVIILDAGHMHPRKPDLTRKLVNISRDWLLEKTAINR